MEFADSKKEDFPSLEIRIEDFRRRRNRIELFGDVDLSNEIPKTSIEVHLSHGFPISYYVIVPLDGVNEETEGWLAVVPTIGLHKGFMILHDTVLSWIVSIIDIDGNSRFPRSFELHYDEGKRLGGLSADNFSKMTYLERSFILSRADEFLPEGVLTLRCDIFFSWSVVSPSYPSARITDRQTSPFENFLRVIPQRVCSKNDGETGDPSDTFTEFDFTSCEVTRSRFHNMIFNSGCPTTYDMLIPLKSKEDGTNISEHVWIFDVRPDRFLLSLDGRQDSAGVRLLKASSLIRHCIEVPLKGQQENYLELPNVDSETFKVVLFFLASGTLPNSEFGDLKKVYKVSHLYEMEELQRRCAKCMAESIEPESNFEKELEGIADLYSDEYLSELLKSRRRENLEKDLLRLRVDDRAYSDCYN